tara:strand:- start:2615 stop:3052 length:438 start_codon:yes stop_codon:yes gene_type:complete
MIKKNKLLLLSIFIASFSYSQSYNIEGDWYTENNDAIIKIYKDGNTLSGKITWMKTPNDENGNPKTDPENPDEKLKSRKRLGMIMMNNFSYDEEEQWDDGEIYDPESGNTYSGIITMTSKNKLDLRGYVGISWFGRTSQWTRKTN